MCICARSVGTVSEASEVSPPLMQSAEGVRMPYLTPGGVLGIPFDSPERFHWWKGGQSIAETRAEVNSDGDIKNEGQPCHESPHRRWEAP